jgi:hypothetical protein
MDHQNQQDIFIITSVIKTGNVPWTYAHRSSFTPEQRLEQTMNTISTIRAKTNAFIILVECSDISLEVEDVLKSSVDCFIQTYGNEYIRDKCIYSAVKGHGEVLQILAATEFIKQRKLLFRRLFKISGRYFLNDNFNIDLFTDTEYTCKTDGCNVITVLYSVPYVMFDHYIWVLHDVDKYVSIHHHSQILEAVMYPRLQPATDLPVLGAAGYIATFTNEFWSR